MEFLREWWGLDQPSDFEEAKRIAFEKVLFEDGVLEFDYDKFMEDKYQEYLTHGRPQISRQEMEIVKYEVEWLQYFNGNLPKKWENHWNVYGTFREAGEKSVQLSRVLVNAGVSHPSPHVVAIVGTTQRLNEDQLTFLFHRDAASPRSIEEIIQFQRNKGVSNYRIQAARQIATDLKKWSKEASMPR